MFGTGCKKGIPGNWVDFNWTTTVLLQLITREVELSLLFLCSTGKQFSVKSESANFRISQNFYWYAVGNNSSTEFFVSPLQYVIPANWLSTTFSVGRLKRNAPGQAHFDDFLLSHTAFWLRKSSQRTYASLFFNCNSRSSDPNISHHSSFLRQKLGSWACLNRRLQRSLHCP